jgi:hypothetical protein
MALFSDIDWIIILAAALFLLLGKDSGQVLRQMGRWYGRAGRIKQELLGEFAKAAELPAAPPGAPLSFRGMLMGIDPVPTQTPGIPAAVRIPPGPAPAPPAVPTPPTPWTGGAPVPTWSMTMPVAPSEWEITR